VLIKEIIRRHTKTHKREGHVEAQRYRKRHVKMEAEIRAMGLGFPSQGMSGCLHY